MTHLRLATVLLCILLGLQLQAAKPIGALTLVTPEIAQGWAYDPDNPAAQIDVHLYLTMLNGANLIQGAVKADKTIPGLGHDGHCFTFAIPVAAHDGAILAKGQDFYHRLSAYGINWPGTTGQNALLTGTQAVPHLVRLQNAYTYVDLHLNAGGILYSFVNNQGPGGARELVESAFNGLYDYGCSIQTALWDGNPGMTFENYNPTQGGDNEGHGAGIQAYLRYDEGNNNNSFYTRSQTVEWNPMLVSGGTAHLVWSDIIIEQWVRLSNDGVVRVVTLATHAGADSHGATPQTIPILHLKQDLSQVTTYSGPNPWTNDPVLFSYPNPTGSYGMPIMTEKWAALHNPTTNYGLTVKSDVTTFSGQYIPMPGMTPSGIHQYMPYINTGFAPVNTPGYQLSQTVYLIPGTPAAGRAYIYSNNLR